MSSALRDAPVDQWRQLLQFHPNVLLEGRQSFVEETLVALNRDFYPVKCRWNGMPPSPQPVARATIIVHEIAHLNATDRATLCRWLDQVNCTIQIVATSSEPVFPLVQRNIFPADLYYRLNIVRFALS